MEAFSEVCSLDGRLSAQWNSMPFVQEDSCNGKTKDIFHRSQYGMMFVPSMDAHGEALLTWFQEGFLAKTSVSQEKELASLEAGLDSGLRWQESSEKYAHNTRSSKTHQCLGNVGSISSYETLPNWGSMQGGECWEDFLPDYVSTVSACGSSLIGPVATDSFGFRIRLQSLVRKHHPDGNLSQQLARVYQRKITPSVTETLMCFPLGWTGCEPLGTDKFQFWLNSRGMPYRLPDKNIDDSI